MTTSAPTQSASAPKPTSSAIADGVERVAKSAHSGIDAAADAAAPVVERVSAAAHDAVTRADAAGEALGERGDKLIASTSAYMREHPIASLGMAVAAGYVLSRLLSR